MKDKIVVFSEKLDVWLCLKLRPLWLRIWWHELWIREDEFHASNNIDTKATLSMGRDRREIYMNRLLIKRDLAHENKRSWFLWRKFKKKISTIEGMWFDTTILRNRLD